MLKISLAKMGSSVFSLPGVTFICFDVIVSGDSKTRGVGGKSERGTDKDEDWVNVGPAIKYLGEIGGRG